MTQTLMLILEKIGSKDRDFRYMATSDLQTELIQGKFKTDPETERKLCTALVNQLDDAGDISGLAVKCLGLLIRKVGEQRAEDTIKVLCDKVVNVSTSNKQQQRDIASIALKTVISDIPGGNLAVNGSAIIANKMLEAVGKESSDAVGDALDILTEVLLKFGSLLGSLLGAIQVALLSLLDDPRAAVRKRAMHCTGALSMFLPDAPLASLVQSLLERLQQPGLKPDMVHIYVQAMGQVRGGSDDDAYSDDEEQSWKVRRAAAKLLSALASSYVDAIPQVYGSAATELVSRFKEREENVKVDVFATFVVLARQVAAAAKRFAPDDPESPLAKLSADVPHVLRGLSRTLLAKNPKTKVAAF
ncbi:TIP120 domain-containing protein, partial [Haematococcus lacustris]